MRKLFCYFFIFIGIILTNCSTGPDTTTYDVTVSVSPAGSGTIFPSADSSYEEGQSIRLQANPSDNYVFTEWTGDNETTTNPLSLTADQNYALTANFRLKEYELSITTDGNGTVSETVLEEKSKEYEHGTVVELTATPAEGWKFVEWKGAVSGTENPTQITVDNPKEVTAVFEKKSYELTVTTKGKGAVTQSTIDEKTKSYQPETRVKLTAMPSEGSKFVEWKGAITGNGNPAEIVMDQAKEVTVVFNKYQSFIKSDFYSTTVLNNLVRVARFDLKNDLSKTITLLKVNLIDNEGNEYFDDGAIDLNEQITSDSWTSWGINLNYGLPTVEEFNNFKIEYTIEYDSFTFIKTGTVDTTESSKKSKITNTINYLNVD